MREFLERLLHEIERRFLPDFQVGQNDGFPLLGVESRGGRLEIGSGGDGIFRACEHFLREIEEPRVVIHQKDAKDSHGGTILPRSGSTRIGRITPARGMSPMTGDSWLARGAPRLRSRSCGRSVAVN